MLYGEPEDEELAAEEQAASLRVSERVLLRTTEHGNPTGL